MNEQADITNDDSLGKSFTDSDSSNESWQLKMKKGEEKLTRTMRWGTVIVLLTLMLSMIIISMDR